MEVIVILIVLIGAAFLITQLSGREDHKNLSRRKDRNPHRPPPAFRPNPTYRNFAKPKPAARSTPQSTSARPDLEGLELPPIPSSLTIVGKAYVIDGDTIRISKTKIRIAGIDAPEVDMPWGQKSKWAMVKICKGHIVTAKLDGERSYDRLVATCYLGDGTDIGAEIIKQGHALDLPHFSGGKYRHHEPDGARRRLANGKFGHRSIKKSDVG